MAGLAFNSFQLRKILILFMRRNQYKHLFLAFKNRGRGNVLRHNPPGGGGGVGVKQRKASNYLLFSMMIWICTMYNNLTFSLHYYSFPLQVETFLCTAWACCPTTSSPFTLVIWCKPCKLRLKISPVLC